jgi:hypothetical protein
MIVVMKAGATNEEIDRVVTRVEGLGYRAHLIRGVERTVIGCVGDERLDKSIIAEPFSMQVIAMPSSSPSAGQPGISAAALGNSYQRPGIHGGGSCRDGGPLLRGGGAPDRGGTR